MQHTIIHNPITNNNYFDIGDAEDSILLKTATAIIPIVGLIIGGICDMGLIYKYVNTTSTAVNDQTNNKRKINLLNLKMQYSICEIFNALINSSIIISLLALGIITNATPILAIAAAFGISSQIGVILGNTAWIIIGHIQISSIN